MFPADLFEKAYVWLRRSDDPFVRNLSAVCDTTFSPSFQSGGAVEHQSDFLFRITGKSGAPMFSWPSAAASASTRTAVVFHPGSAGRAKRWPFENFLRVRERIPGPVVWILGPAEEELRGEIPAGDETAFGVSLRDVRERLLGASLFIGNDSGISHLAALCNAPSVVLFGPTDPRIWAPRGPVHVLHSPGPEVSLPVKDVLDLVNAVTLSKAE